MKSGPVYLPLKITKMAIKSGELLIFIFALSLATFNISIISLFTSQVKEAINNNAVQLLGADIIISSYKPIPQSWIQKAKFLNLNISNKKNFLSMVSFNDAFKLASISAVDQNFPLIGTISLKKNTVFFTHRPPPPGEIYIAPRLIDQLELKLNDRVNVGSTELTLTASLLNMPDVSMDLINLSPRVLINNADLNKTKLVQPGSRINYQVLFQGSATSIQSFIKWIQPKLNPTIKLTTPQSMSSNLKLIFNKTIRFINLIILITVLLAGVSLFMCTHLFFKKQKSFIALLSTFGIHYTKIILLYTGVFLIIGVISFITGVVLAEGIRLFLLYWFSSNQFIQLLPPPDYSVLWLSVTTACLLTIGFSLPRLLIVRTIRPLSLIKQLNEEFTWYSVALFCIALFSALMIIVLYTQDYRLTYNFSLIMFIIFAITYLVLDYFKWFIKKIASFCSGSTKLALTLFSQQTVTMKIQVITFSLIILLVVFVSIIQTSLIHYFQDTLPPNTPNYFLINIDPDQKKPTENFIKKHNINSKPLYPIIRGRLIKLNNKPILTAIKPSGRNNGALYRALNLTYTNTIPYENKIIQGKWFNTQTQSGNEISVSSSLANQLGIKLHDTLTFSIGSQELTGKVTSLRTIDWKTYTPNFFFIFNKKALQSYPTTYMTSLHLLSNQIQLVNTLLNQFPNITVFDIASLVKKAQNTLEKIKQGIAALGVFILLASFSIFLANVQSAMDENKRRMALLRMFGASTLKITLISLAQYTLLGCIAGLMGALGGNFVAMYIGNMLFNIDYFSTVADNVLAPIVGIIVITVFGLIANIKLLLTPPKRTLRVLL